MKDYKRLTEKDSCYYDDMERIDDLGGADILYDRLAYLEEKIESGELCDRKETAREILVLLGKGFDEITRKDFKDLSWYKQFCRELKLRYGVKLEDEE